MQHSVQTGCEELLLDKDVFHRALEQYLSCKQTDMQLNQHNDKHPEQSVLGLLLLIDFVFDMLRDCGLTVQHTVYNTVRHKADPHFDEADGWYKCVFSGLLSRRCLRVDAHIVVHEQYSKWLRCVWLATHMHEVEQQRRNVSMCKEISEIPRHDAELYRAALRFVLQQLQQLYAHLASSGT